MNIALIPARGGSKRIPRKNIKFFNGKAMLEYAVSLALSVEHFDSVVVSSDDAEILSLAESLGAAVPFVRPEHLSNDFATTTEVVQHMIGFYETNGIALESVCCIYPAVPFLHADDVNSGISKLLEFPSKIVFPVARYESNIQRSLSMEHGGSLQTFFSKNTATRTQDLSDAVYDLGQFYIAKASTWMNAKDIHGNGVGLEKAGWKFVDIDNQNDWERAEKLHKFLKWDSSN